MGRQAGGGSPPEGNRLPFIPTQKGPSEPPAPPPARAAGAVARRGALWRRQGLLVTGSLPGSLGTGRGRWGAELHPPAPAWHRGTAGIRLLPWPCQHQQHPQPCPGADPNPSDTQTLLCATLGAWHDMVGTAQHPAWVWNWGLEHFPRCGWKGSAKQVLVPAPSLHHPSTASSGQGC